jgi:hypothetical protein
MKTTSISNGIRTRTLATRLNDAEIRAVEVAAEAGGITRSQWLRDTVVARLRQTDQAPRVTLELPILAEILALRLLILNMFAAAVPGVALTSLRQIMAYADSAKHAEVAKLLRNLDESP